jgi:DNA invertase Pin-like site-specific DNA recombinase
MGKSSKHVSQTDDRRLTRVKHAIVYPRRSFEKGDDKYTLSTQRDAGRKYAELHGFEVVCDEAEEFTGTVHLRDRKVGAKVWSMLVQHEAEALIVYAADRLSRADLIDALPMIGEILRMGIEIHTLDGGVIRDPNDIGTIIRLWQSSEERKKIIERTARGKQRKIDEGKIVGNGFMPYWLDKIGVGRNATYQLNPERSVVMRQIIDWYLGKNGEQPIGIYMIRDRLIAAGVVGHNGALLWQKSTLFRLLKNPNLYGCFKHGDRLIQRDELALIDRATFDRIQEQRASNRKLAKRNMKYPFLLTHHLHCACDRLLYGHSAAASRTTGYIWRAYQCSAMAIAKDYRDCVVQPINAVYVDDLLWKYVRSLLSPEFLEESLRYLNAQAVTAPETSAQLAQWDDKLNRLQAKIDRLINEFGETSDEKLAADVRRQISLARAEFDQATGERAKLEHVWNRQVAIESEREVLASQIEQLARKIDAADFPVKRNILDILDVRGKLHFDERGERWLAVECSIAPLKEFRLPDLRRK